MVTVKFSADFKKQARRAIGSVVLFIVTYLVLLVLAIGLTIACVSGGIFLIALYPTFITLALGVGLASLGVLVLIFLVKFVSQSRQDDKSHLLEVTREAEPKLFAMIEELVTEVETSFPKRVYLSGDVNASVSYDSSFWSMFLPVRKNLQIGIGLVNSLTISELKAVLAHEFGHFSQRTMKVGSYVYNVNQVVFNMLFQNDGYNNLIQRWGSVSGYFSIFIGLAKGVILGIQGILRKLYEVVNKSYLGLSREMEFHADEIAAQVVGSEPFQQALLRITIADQAMNTVLHFYDTEAMRKTRSQNIFREQSFVMRFLADQNNIHVIDGLPLLTHQEYSRFNRSKLVIKDQWASHPTTEERVERLQELNHERKTNSNELAGLLFSDYEQIQKSLTDFLFKRVAERKNTRIVEEQEFQEGFMKEFRNSSFPDCFNGYYDDKSPVAFATYGSLSDDNYRHDLFARDHVDKVYYGIALKNDVDIIRQIADGKIPIKTFDYDGRKYNAVEASSLVLQVESELTQLNREIEQHDEIIYRHFRSLEQKLGVNRLTALYSSLAQAEKDIESDGAFISNLASELNFTQVTTPTDTIQENFDRIRPIETEFKEKIRKILETPRHQNELTTEVRQKFERYISKDWNYFGLQTYLSENLELLFACMHQFSAVLSRDFFLTKRDLLAYQEGLMTGSVITSPDHQ